MDLFGNGIVAMAEEPERLNMFKKPGTHLQPSECPI